MSKFRSASIIVYLLISIFFSTLLYGCSSQKNYSKLLDSLEITKTSIDYDLKYIEDMTSKIPESYEDILVISSEFQNIKLAYQETEGLNLDTSTEKMLLLYKALMDANKGSGHWQLDKLLEETGTLLLFGRWSQGSNYIGLQRTYSDYNNTKYTDWLNGQLPNSKASNREYYYYIEYKNDKLVIGYEDIITEEKTDNYEITYKVSEMSLKSLIENKVYNMTIDTSQKREIKGNAKMAYEYIASIIRQFKNPTSVVILRAQVKDDKVYIYSEASNQVGGKVQNYYEITKNGNNYYYNETSQFTNNNVNLDELNNRLQNFLKP